MFIEIQYLITNYINRIIGHKFMYPKLIFLLNPLKSIPMNINKNTVYGVLHEMLRGLIFSDRKGMGK